VKLQLNFLEILATDDLGYRYPFLTGLHDLLARIHLIEPIGTGVIIGFKDLSDRTRIIMTASDGLVSALGQILNDFLYVQPVLSSPSMASLKIRRTQPAKIPGR